MPRFVILLHETPSGHERPTHWDFMLESASVLKTWALPQDPAETHIQEAQLLDDHRVAYLDYEGPLSGNRGTVARWDEGTYSVLQQDETQWCVQIDGARLHGRVTLERRGEDASEYRWTYQPTVP